MRTRSDVKKLKKLNTSQIIALGFAGVIFVGALLLWLPISTASGEQTSFVDALFTSTTSVCVTGLVTVTTATHWSLFGKIVILFLIQMGGLGVVTIGTLLFLMLGRRISMTNRKMIQESYNLDHMSGMVILIKKVVRGALGVELIGAVLYSFRFIPQFGLVKGIWESVFTAVSAFCNAGIDVLGENSLVPYVSDPVVNFTTMALIIMGGLGFTVWWDVAGTIKKVLLGKIPRGKFWKALKVHSKLAIVMTAILVFGGTLLIFLLEYSNPQTIGNFSLGDKLMASAFQSVTTRTAGFLTIDQASFTDASMVVTLVWMFIGGSPMGTAGGVKTTTMAMMMLTIVAYLRGRKDTEVFHRKVKGENVRTAMVVVSIFFAVLFLSSILLSVVTDGLFIDIVYEVVSALGTVGLTRGLTGSLNVLGKLIIIATMYIGRAGPITLAMAINLRSKGVADNVHLAESRILIG